MDELGNASFLAKLLLISTPLIVINQTASQLVCLHLPYNKNIHFDGSYLLRGAGFLLNWVLHKNPFISKELST